MAIGPFFFYSRARGGWSDLKPSDVSIQGWILDELYQDWRQVPGINHGDGHWERARVDEMAARIINMINAGRGAGTEVEWRGPTAEALAVAADYLLERGYPGPIRR